MKRKNGEGTWGKKTVKGHLYFYYRDTDGNYTYGKTEKEVREKLKAAAEQAKYAKSASDLQARPDITVGEYVKRYIEAAKSTLQPYTYYNYTHMVDTLLMKNTKLARHQMKSLTPDMVTIYLAELGKKYSYGTVVSICKILKVALHDAEDNGYLRPNTVRKIKVPKERYCQEGRDQYIPNPEEMKIIEDYCLKKNKKGKYVMLQNGLAYVVIMNTGMRVGELIALHWPEVNFEKRTISIVRSGSYRSENGSLIYEEKEPKTPTSYRTIPMNDTVYGIIEYLRDNYPDVQNEDHVFLNKNNVHLSKTTLEHIIRRRVSKDLNMPGLTPHALRHAFSSYLASRRVNPKVIAKLMGHSKVDITFNVYVDGYEEELIDATKMLGDI